MNLDFNEQPDITVQAPRRGEPAVMLGNLSTTELLNDLVGEELFRGQEFTGMCLSPAGARLIGGRLRQAIAIGGLQGLEMFWTKRELHRVLHAFNEVSATVDTLYMDASADRGDSEATHRHELAHFAQRRLGQLDDDSEDAAVAFLEHPIAQKAAEVLIRVFNYEDEPRILAAEIGAHLAEGPAGVEQMGLTTEEGAELAELYFGALVERHGNVVYHLRALTEVLGRVHERDFRTDGEEQSSKGGGPAERRGIAEHASAHAGGPSVSTGRS